MPRKNEPTTRTCVVTRETLPPEAMIRFVLDPEGVVVPDLKRQLPGRGVWVRARRADIETATRKRAFDRGFKTRVVVEPDLADMVDRLLEAGALGSLGLARKAGDVVTGFAKVEAALGAGRAVAVLHAREAAPDGVRKLGGAIARTGNAVRALSPFTSAQMDLALGGMNVIHAALKAGPAGAAALRRIDALVAYRGEDDAARPAAHARISGGHAPGEELVGE